MQLTLDIQSLILEQPLAGQTNEAFQNQLQTRLQELMQAGGSLHAEQKPQGDVGASLTDRVAQAIFEQLPPAAISNRNTQ